MLVVLGRRRPHSRGLLPLSLGLQGRHLLAMDWVGKGRRTHPMSGGGLIRHRPGDRQRAEAAAVGRWTEEELGRMRVTYDGKHGAGVEGGACTRTGAKKNAGGLCAYTFVRMLMVYLSNQNLLGGYCY